MHYRQFCRLLNPFHNSGFKDIGSGYQEVSTVEGLFVGIKGLCKSDLFRNNRESRNIPFFKMKLDVYAITQVNVDTQVPEIPNIQIKLVDKGNGQQVNEVSVKLKKKPVSRFAGEWVFMGNRTTSFAFERPDSFFDRIKIRVYYCEGMLYTPVEHSCDKLDLWPEWPEEPADDSFLHDLILERNQRDIYVLLTDGKGEYLNASSYFWDENKPHSLAWFIKQFVNETEIRPSNELFKMTIEGLIKIERWLAPELFIHAHKAYFKTALFEIILYKRKITHWMWFVFPQMMFKYPSELSMIYSLDIELMFQYRRNFYLMKNMEEMLLVLLDDDCPAQAHKVFGRDTGKFRDSLWFFIHFNSKFSEFKANFALPELDELFLKVYSKFFGSNLPVEQYHIYRKDPATSNYHHFHILVEHYKVDYEVNSYQRMKEYFRPKIS